MLSAILGSCVVFPEPVSPQTMTTWWVEMAAAISSRLPETGNDSGNVMDKEGVEDCNKNKPDGKTEDQPEHRAWHLA